MPRDLSLPELAKGLADGLRRTVRRGAATDVPEGARFVVFSDTLVTQISDQLSRAVERDEVQRLKEPAQY